MPLAVGQMLQNRYRIEALLGQGGFGAVYRAVDLNINFRVAIKENLDASPEAQRQFAREAALMVRLRHPSLPRVTDTFFIPGWGSYLVMDLIEGQTFVGGSTSRAIPLRGRKRLPKRFAETSEV